MVKMKENLKYYFTVDGETEKWYLKWLQKQINNEPTAKYTVSLNSPDYNNPLKYAKSLVVTGKTEITHICDYESNEKMHTDHFINTLYLMKESEKIGKQIKYKLGYSNFSFELWMVLHKTDCNGPLTHRNNYLEPINRAYSENFENLEQYKKEANFKKVLGKITLTEVKEAIIRSKKIMQKNEGNGFTLHQYKGYKYYTENPALTIWEAIEKILKDCKIL